MYVIIGTMIDLRGTTWVGNPCDANPIWVVAGYNDEKQAQNMCSKLNKVANGTS
jgi:hypothetical protein